MEESEKSGDSIPPKASSRQDSISKITGLTIEEENAQLRTMIRKLRGGIRWWASLSYVDGVRGRSSSWTPAERALLHKVFGDGE